MATLLALPGQRHLVLPLKTHRPTTVSKRKFAAAAAADGDDDDADDKPLPPGASPFAMLAKKKKAYQCYQHQQIRQSSRQTVPKRAVKDGPQLDPFDSFPIISTPDVPRMAQYYVQVWAPEHGGAFGFQGHPNPYLSLLWPFAMQNDLYFEALIALCLATWLPSQGIPAKQDRRFLYHRGNVVTKLRARLASPQHCADDATILTVATLGTIDYVFGAHDTALGHVDGMRQMVKMRGGFPGHSPFYHLLQANVAAFEALWSFITESTTPVEESPNPTTLLMQGQLPTYMHHPFKPEVCTMMSKLPRGFCEIGLKGCLSMQMIRILTSLNDSPSNGALPSTPTAYPPTPESLPSPVSASSAHVLPYIRETLQDLHRLATLRTTLTEHILCYGLIAHCYTLRHVYFNDSFGAFYTSVVDTLTQKCVRHDPEVEDLDRKCYLWCSVVIATTLMNISYSATSRFLLFEHIMKKYPEVKNWNRLQTLMQEFFWADELGGVVKRSWDEAKARSLLPESERTRVQKKPNRMSIRDVIS